jgi:hypothetical protein
LFRNIDYFLLSWADFGFIVAGSFLIGLGSSMKERGITFFEEGGSRLRFFGALMPGMADGEATIGKVFAADQRPNRDTLILGALQRTLTIFTDVNTKNANPIKFKNVKYHYGDL